MTKNIAYLSIIVDIIFTKLLLKSIDVILFINRNNGVTLDNCGF